MCFAENKIRVSRARLFRFTKIVPFLQRLCCLCQVKSKGSVRHTASVQTGDREREREKGKRKREREKERRRECRLECKRVCAAKLLNGRLRISVRKITRGMDLTFVRKDRRDRQNFDGYEDEQGFF